MVTVTRTSPEASAIAKKIKDANSEHIQILTEDGATIVIDSKGRKLKVREPSIIQESRLMRTLGDAAGNSSYVMGYVLPAAMVVGIDEDLVAFPTNMIQIESSIQLVGREGITAVMEYIIAKAEGQKEEANAALKKSAAPRDSETLAGS